MNYLALHIDMDFLVGTICANENFNSYPIIDGNEEFLWLYFYNDPYQNIVSFGKENQKYCKKGEINYFGNFIELIEKHDITFNIGEYKYPIIELLRHSKLIKKLKDSFVEKARESSEDIPTLLTFSWSVSELAKQKLVEYLIAQGFYIISYTIPLSELACFNAIKKGKVNFANGNIVAFLEASNTDLHLMKLIFSSNYFLLDAKPETKKGLGIDPRKRALLKYVVNKIGTMGVLSEQEKETEYKIMEPKTDEWLHKLDLQTNNCPVDVIESLSKMQNAKRRVLLYKDKIAEFTGNDIQMILDYYYDYVNRNINQGVAAIILLGNCFQNEIIRKKFENIVGPNKLYFFANEDIPDILAMYPKIDITRYADEGIRIKERAKAEELKQAEQRAFEDRQRKEQEAAAEKAEMEQKVEENRKEAKKLFDRAVGLEKEGKLEDARVKVENAIAFEKTNKEYKQFFDDLKEKIKKLAEKTELYKKYLSNADSFLEIGDLEKALEKYEEAKYVFDNAEIIEKIIEIKRLIKDNEKRKAKIARLVTEANEFVKLKDFQKAKSRINEILSIDKANTDANIILSEISQTLYQQEKFFKDFVKSADKHFDSSNFIDAIEHYKQALSIRSDDTYCLQQIEKISETIQKQKENKEKCEKIMEKGDVLFQNERWIESQSQYQLALNLCPLDKSALIKLNECNAKIKEQEDTFTDLLLQANIFEKKGKHKNALEALETAKKIRPDNEDIKKRIKKVKFNLDFEDNGNSSSVPQKPSKDDINKEEDFFDLKPKIESTKKIEDNDVFLGIKTAKTILNNKPVEDDFFVKKLKKNIDDEDDFLGPKKKN